MIRWESSDLLWVAVGRATSLVLAISGCHHLRGAVAIVVCVTSAHHAVLLVLHRAVVPVHIFPAVGRAAVVVQHGGAPPVHEHRLQHQGEV